MPRGCSLLHWQRWQGVLRTRGHGLRSGCCRRTPLLAVRGILASAVLGVCHLGWRPPLWRCVCGRPERMPLRWERARLRPLVTPPTDLAQLGVGVMPRTLLHGPVAMQRLLWPMQRLRGPPTG